MQITNIKANVLTELLEPLVAVISDGHILPILQNVKIDFNDGILSATGDNTEINAVNKIDFAGLENFSFCANYQFIFRALKSLGQGNISLTISDDNLIIKHSKGVFDIPLDSVNEFPKVESSDFSLKAKVNGTDLKNSLKIANKFLLNSDLEPMSNVSIQIDKNIDIRSTNRVCLFHEQIKGKGDKADLLISGKSSTALLNLLGDSKTVLKYNENKLFFNSKDMDVMVVQQGGTFPIAMFSNVTKVAKSAEVLKTDYKELVTSIKRTSLLSTKEKFSPLRLNITKDEITASFDNTNSSTKASETIDAKFHKEITVGFDYKLINEVLSVFDEDCTFRIANDNNFLCLEKDGKLGILAPTILEN